MRPDTLGIIGLGAIGGSVAWGAAKSGIRVLGYSTAPREGVAAARAGALQEVATSARQVVQTADLVVLAAPPAVNIQLLEKWGGAVASRGALITDVTSVKQPIVASAARLGIGPAFAGSHPFAGTHARGFSAATPDLLHRAVVYVVATPDGEAAAREIADFWSTVFDAQVVRMDGPTHDARLARTSHLPQAVASALAATLARHARWGIAVGPGARDTTRLAASSVEMWRDLLLLNRTDVLGALDDFQAEVGALRRALEAGDAEAVTTWLTAAARWRESVG